MSTGRSSSIISRNLLQYYKRETPQLPHTNIRQCLRTEDDAHMLFLKKHSWHYYIPRNMGEFLSHIACGILYFSFLSSLYIIFLPRVNYSITNMGYLFYTLLHKIMGNSNIIQRHYYLPRNIIYSNTPLQ